MPQAGEGGEEGATEERKTEEEKEGIGLGMGGGGGGPLHQRHCEVE